MLPIIKGQEMPKPANRNTGDSRRKYPFEKMEVGDMFFVPGKKRNTMTSYIASINKSSDARFSSRLTYMRQIEGEWVACEVSDEGATIGVCVRRVE